MNPGFTFILSVFFLTFFLSFFYKKINKSIIFTPIIISQATFSISVATVGYLYAKGNMVYDDFFNILIQFIIFFAFYLVAPWFVKKPFFDICKLSKIKKFDLQVTEWVFYFTFLILVLYSCLLWGAYTSGDERLLLNKELRSLSIIVLLFSGWSSATLSFIYAVARKRRYLLMFLSLLVISIFTGSKGAVLSNLLLFFFFFLQFNSVNKKTYFLLTCAIVFGIFLPTFVMYGPGFFDKILNRIIMSGDIYFYSFVIGDYRDLIGYYDPLSYLLHPFTSIFGIRGYDYPLGAQILSTAGMPVTGMGPNSHLTILNLAFWGGDTISIIFTTLLFVLISVFSFWSAFMVLRYRKMHLVFRVFLFSTLYTSFMSIFIDIGMFQFKLIICLLGFCLYFTLVNLKNISKNVIYNRTNP